VSEETAGAESAPESPGAGVDPVAVALALGGASQERADAFLKRQEAFIDLQAKELAHELKLRHWSLRIRHLSALLRLTLEVSAALVVLGFVGVGVASLWKAAHSDGLVIESFTVPPDLATKGFSGDVVATTLLDKLNIIQEAIPNLSRPGRSVSGGWGDDIKVEIPETGISVGDAWRFIRRWLGRETHVSGEVVHDGAGLALMVRIDGRHAVRYAGPESGLDSLMLKAAEHVFDVTQPAIYGSYLTTLDPPRVEEAVAVMQRGAADLALPAAERARTLNNLSLVYHQYMADDRMVAELSRQAVSIAPKETPVANSNLAAAELALGHPEAALQIWPIGLRMFLRDISEFYADSATALPAYMRANMASLVGDYAEAVRQYRIALAADRAYRQFGYHWAVAIALAGQHDGGAAHGEQARIGRPTRPYEKIYHPTYQMRVAVALQQWPRVIALAPEAEKAITQSFHIDVANYTATQLRPWTALAEAATGDLAGAQSVIGTTPGDCYDCVRVRGRIATQARQWGRADYWFAKAVRVAPSIPFAHEDWGRSLLARDKPDDAIVQFKLANQKGPYFADPLEGWGEALMAKNQSHLALAKFADAEKYAPNWGRLHLKWGEALGYVGKNDEAKKQFALATGLDLTPADKAELARQSPHA